MNNSNYTKEDIPSEVSNCLETEKLSGQSMSSRFNKTRTHSSYSKTRRSLEDLNLIDAFLFSASTEKIQDAEVIARIIVERATGRKLGKVIIETEKQLLGIDTEHRGVRLDICISEIDNEKIARVYDIEPNTYDFSLLPKRDRYNQSISDVKLLDRGADFRDLPEYVSIWILPSDPFGEDRMIYTVKNMVVENNKMVYNDGVTRLFLNTKGKNGGTEALKALLDYFSISCKANAIDSDLEKLHNIVTDVKQSREVGERYMTLQEYTDYIIEEEVKARVKAGVKAGVEAEIESAVQRAREQGLEQGLERSLEILIRSSINLGATKEQISNILIKEYSLTEEEANERIRAVNEY